MHVCILLPYIYTYTYTYTYTHTHTYTRTHVHTLFESPLFVTVWLPLATSVTCTYHLRRLDLVSAPALSISLSLSLPSICMSLSLSLSLCVPLSLSPNLEGPAQWFLGTGVRLRFGGSEIDSRTVQQVQFTCNLKIPNLELENLCTKNP